MVTKGKRRRARCVYCGKSRAVTPAGKIWAHYVTAAPNTLAAGQRVLCGGTGRPA